MESVTANDHLVAALKERLRESQADADGPTCDENRIYLKAA
jgi:hypothetical protein